MCGIRIPTLSTRHGAGANWTLEETGLEGLLVFDGRRLKIAGRAGLSKPLTVTERLILQRQLARAEFLARTRINW